MNFLDFEKPIAELEGAIQELRRRADAGDLNIADEIQRLQEKSERLLVQTYSRLTPAQRVQVARHQDRPHAMAYIDALVEDFVPLAGDRLYREDHAIVAGMGRFGGRAVMVIGQEKGHDLETRLKRNFGMARPEGYRKAQRLMRLADRFGLPVITLVDTAGAYPGVGAEERGQSEAIARSIETCMQLSVPIIATIIGEGGSGGAIAIATADRVLMLEHSIYSVISPEGCASILWRSAEQAAEAAAALKMTAADLKELKVIDDIIKEPLGGAHRDRDAVFAAVRQAVAKALGEALAIPTERRRQARRDKFLAIGTAEAA